MDKPQIDTPPAKTSYASVIWWGTALGLIIGCALIPISGFDWIMFYYPRSHDFSPDVVANPLWIYFILTPIAYFPVKVSYALFLLVNVAIIWLISKLGTTNRFGLLLSFPSLWILWYGQLDYFVALGAVLGFWAVQDKKPVILGFALLLLLVKPHIGGPLAVAYFVWLRDWRALATCGVILFLSMMIWRFDWPVVWAKSLLFFSRPASDGVIPTADQQTNISLYPYGLLCWLFLLWPMSRVERAIAILSATYLSAPYAPVYSLVVLLALPLPGWTYLLSSTPLVLGPKGYWLTTFVPVGCLIWLVGRQLLPDKKIYMISDYIASLRK